MRRVLRSVLMAICGGIAGVLAMVGIYPTMAYSMSLRTNSAFASRAAVPLATC